jgi:hypothetical protein
VASHRSRLLILSTLVAAMLFVAAAPSTAEAQRRYRRPAPVVVIGGYAYYHHWLYDPWYQWGPWGPYGYPRYQYGVYDLVASVRIDAEPRQAQVFVDGYYAGVVDDFDGVFQRLRVEPGGRTITLYLEGYRTEEQRLYLRPGADQRIRLTMQPLAPGEQSEPPMPPREAGEESGVEERGGPVMPREGERPAPLPRDGEVRPAQARFGTLSLRVQPADAEVVIDGEPWRVEAGQEVIAIQLPEGRHRVEVRKAGLATYTEEVLIRRDRTLTLNVSLR